MMGSVDVSELREALRTLDERIKTLDEKVFTMQDGEFKQLHTELSEIRGTVLAVKKIADSLHLLGVAVRWVTSIAVPVVTLWYLWRDHR